MHARLGAVPQESTGLSRPRGQHGGAVPRSVGHPSHQTQVSGNDSHGQAPENHRRHDLGWNNTPSGAMWQVPCQDDCLDWGNWRNITCAPQAVQYSLRQATPRRRRARRYDDTDAVNFLVHRDVAVPRSHPRPAPRSRALTCRIDCTRTTVMARPRRAERSHAASTVHGRQSWRGHSVLSRFAPHIMSARLRPFFGIRMLCPTRVARLCPTTERAPRPSRQHARPGRVGACQETQRRDAGSRQG